MRTFLTISQLLLAALALLASGSIHRPIFAQNKEKKPDSGSSALKPCSSIELEAPIASYSASDNDKIVVMTENGIVQGLEMATGQILWKSELGGLPAAPIASGSSAVYVITNSRGAAENDPSASTLRSLSKQTGVTNWIAKLPPSDNFSLGIVKNSIFAVSAQGDVFAFIADSGEQQWVNKLGSEPSSASIFSPDGVVIPLKGNIAVTLDAEGKQTARLVAGAAITSLHRPETGKLFIGDERGNLTLFDPTSGAVVWKFKSGGAISYIADTKNGVLAGSYDNFLYSIWGYNGDVVWKRRMPGRIVEGVGENGSSIALLVYGERSIFLLEPKKGRILARSELAERNFLRQRPIMSGTDIIFANGSSVVIYNTEKCAVNNKSGF